MSDSNPKPESINSESRLRLEKLAAPGRQASLASNLKDFLTERPAKVRAGTPTAFDIPRFGDGFGANFKEIFKTGARGSVKSPLLVNWSAEGTGLWRNLRDWISPPKLPPLETTSQPVDVPEIWTKDTQMPKTQLISILVHVTVIALIVIVPLLFPGIISPPATKASGIVDTDVSVSPYLAHLKPAAQKAGGGGGAHDNAPAMRGKAPKFALTQFAAPLAHPVPHPQLAMTPTIVGNPDIHLPDPAVNNYGDPFSHSGVDSMGNGHGSGVGNGNGSGLGPGEGWNTGGGLPYAGAGGYGQPACFYMPKADYTDEAMKLKIQGSVVLNAVVTADGRVTNPEVAKGLGYGLDEKARDVVRTWRCTPARGPDGKPAAVRVVIEANFQLF